jgi:hypothetical protein
MMRRPMPNSGQIWDVRNFKDKAVRAAIGLDLTSLAYGLLVILMCTTDPRVLHPHAGNDIRSQPAWSAGGVLWPPCAG